MVEHSPQVLASEETSHPEVYRVDRNLVLDTGDIFFDCLVNVLL